MSAIPQRHNQSEAPGTPSQSPEDYYSALVNAIAEAAKDPARVRKLVYAVVRSNLNPESVFAPALTDATWQAKTLDELDQAFQIERAIRRLEERTGPPPPSESEPEWPEPAGFVPEPPEAASAPALRVPIQFQPSLLPLPDGVEPTPPVAPRHVPTVPEAVADVVRALRAQVDRTVSEERLAWTVPASDVLAGKDTQSHAERIWAAWITLPTHVHVVAAALVIATFITGISALVQWSRAGGGTVEALTPAVPTAPAVSVVLKGPKISETTGHASAQATGADRDAPQTLPVPQNFGVYAAHNGLLTQLDQLPVTLAVANMRASAEITQPSRTMLAADKLSFVVFDRDFANGAPQTASVRVIGRVTRLVKYVDGKVRVTPYQGFWRVRDKSYELRVTPLEGRDILVIRPDSGVTLPPGRYALMLNGRGYDFTVAGRITAPEHCLEQTEVVNGTVVGDCTNL